MSIVKSFSVGDGDMFYIKHGSDSFTTIDCCNYGSGRSVDDKLFETHLNEIRNQSKGKGITRFISTHPDDDHIGGLVDFLEKIGIANFYCVSNEATKAKETDDFKKYCSLRDDGKKAFNLYKGCTRKWLNAIDNVRRSAGISCLWPITSNEHYKDALKKAKEGNSPNNISPVIIYRAGDFSVLWMGDMEADFLDEVKGKIDFPEVDVLFAPHHGRESGKIPEELLKKINPKIIVIGEAPSENLNYYNNHETITQNSAGDITFDITEDKLKIYVQKKAYAFKKSKNPAFDSSIHGYYIGYLKNKNK